MQTFSYKAGVVHPGGTCPPASRAFTDHLDIDVYFPAISGEDVLAPIIFFIHGGSWETGDTHHIDWSPAYFLQRGYAVVSAQYGYCCWGFTVFDMAAQLTAAVDYVRANATSWSFDMNRIFVTGASAGGHLALLLAYTFDSPVCGNWSSCGIQGVMDLYGRKDEFGVERLTYLTNSTSVEVWQKAMPLHLITSSSPPTVTFHGTWDRVVPYEGSVRHHQRLEKFGVKHLLVACPTFDHAPERFYWGGPAQIHRYVMERFLTLDEV